MINKCRSFNHYKLTICNVRPIDSSTYHPWVRKPKVLPGQGSDLMCSWLYWRQCENVCVSGSVLCFSHELDFTCCWRDLQGEERPLSLFRFNTFLWAAAHLFIHAFILKSFSSTRGEPGPEQGTWFWSQAQLLFPGISPSI